MRKILINAYACSPGMGSEPGMSWNWVVNLANYCELFIITEGEFRDKIEQVVPTLSQGKNLHFYYNPVSEVVRKMCWNQGDWRFYKYYKDWQWKTYLMAKDICLKEKIDVLHQLNMIGFREPGYLWKLSKETGIPFVWGPIGGLKQFPTAYLEGSGIKMNCFNRLKNRLNVYQVKFDKRVNKALKQANLLISSIPDSYKSIKKYKGLESVIIPETGCFHAAADNIRNFDEGRLHILWVGKFDFRKQLPLALKSLKEANNPNIHLDIYGTGNSSQIGELEMLVKNLQLSDLVTWYGNKPNKDVLDAMRRAHLFFFTSVSEDTSTVVLEAVSNQLPVLCFNTCGMGYVINDAVGRKIELSNPKQSVRDFAAQLNELEGNRQLLKEMALNCKKRQEELSWENKALQMVEYYEKIL